MITTTIRSSISVKPFLFILGLLRSNLLGTVRMRDSLVMADRTYG